MVDAHCVRDEGGFTLQWLVDAFHWVRVHGVGLGLGYIQCKECVNHMPKAFTEVFVASILFHGFYHGSFDGVLF